MTEASVCVQKVDQSSTSPIYLFLIYFNLATVAMGGTHAYTKSTLFIQVFL